MRSFFSFSGPIVSCSPHGRLLLSRKSYLRRLLQKSTVSQSCLQDCLDFAERMKRKALRVRSEGSIPPYVTEAESRKQHSDSPLCNSLLMLLLVGWMALLLVGCKPQGTSQPELPTELSQALDDAAQARRSTHHQEMIQHLLELAQCGA